LQTDIQYEIILQWSKQDQAFIVEVPELPGVSMGTKVTASDWPEPGRQNGSRLESVGKETRNGGRCVEPRHSQRRCEDDFAGLVGGT
jgi:hypothetical protein